MGIGCRRGSIVLVWTCYDSQSSLMRSWEAAQKQNVICKTNPQIFCSDRVAVTSLGCDVLVAVRLRGRGRRLRSGHPLWLQAQTYVSVRLRLDLIASCRHSCCLLGAARGGWMRVLGNDVGRRILLAVVISFKISAKLHWISSGRFWQLPQQHQKCDFEFGSCQSMFFGGHSKGGGRAGGRSTWINPF